MPPRNKPRKLIPSIVIHTMPHLFNDSHEIAPPDDYPRLSFIIHDPMIMESTETPRLEKLEVTPEEFWDRVCTFTKVYLHVAIDDRFEKEWRRFENKVTERLYESSLNISMSDYARKVQAGVFYTDANGNQRYVQPL